MTRRPAISIDTADTYTERTRALERAARNSEGITGLVLLGSTAVSGRRDEWSDHDFFVIAQPDMVDRVRDVRRWLPDPERVVLLAREWATGFAALYDDGHLFEFAAATAAELAGAPIGEHAVVFDDGSIAALVEAAQARAAHASEPAPADEVRLMLVKLLVGVGRARRGEVINGGQFIRTWAVNHFINVLRARFAPAGSDRDPLDATRRLEQDYPRFGEELALVLERPVEEAARGLFEFARAVLEPGWEDFPSRAADVIAQRLWG